jgi:hypothetical protein
MVLKSPAHNPRQVATVKFGIPKGMGNHTAKVFNGLTVDFVFHLEPPVLRQMLWLAHAFELVFESVNLDDRGACH